MIQLLSIVPLYNLMESLYDTFKDAVMPVPGSVVYCDLAFGFMEHSGIYVGHNKIVHLNGNGQIELVTPKEFISSTSAMNIYVSCNEYGSTGDHFVAKRARSMIGCQRGYNFIMDNCHQFTSGCLSGNFENSDNFLWMLKMQVSKNIDANSWRFWSDSGWK